MLNFSKTWIIVVIVVLVMGGLLVETGHAKSNENWIGGGSKMFPMYVQLSRKVVRPGEKVVITVKASESGPLGPPEHEEDYDVYFKLYLKETPERLLKSQKVHIHKEKGETFVWAGPFDWTIQAPAKKGPYTYRVVKKINSEPSFNDFDPAQKVEFEIEVIPQSEKPANVVLSTDKEQYHKGESVEITVRNNSSNPLFLYKGLGFVTIEQKKAGGNWEAIPEIWCPCGAMCEPAFPSLEFLKPNQSLLLKTWDQKISWCASRAVGSGRTQQAPVGEYRVGVTYFSCANTAELINQKRISPSDCQDSVYQTIYAHFKIKDNVLNKSIDKVPILKTIQNEKEWNMYRMAPIVMLLLLGVLSFLVAKFKKTKLRILFICLAIILIIATYLFLNNIGIGEIWHRIW